jgi:hypothetical protein
LIGVFDATSDRPSATKTALDGQNAAPLDALLLYREIKRPAPIACWRAGGEKRALATGLRASRPREPDRDEVARRYIYGVSGCVANGLRRVTKITEWQSEQNDRVCWVVSLLTHRQRIQVFESLERVTSSPPACYRRRGRALRIGGTADRWSLGPTRRLTLKVAPTGNA